MQKADGMMYAPVAQPAPVVQPGEFAFGVIGLDHGHIYGQCNGLIEAGAELRYVWDPDGQKVDAFCKKYPQAQPLRSESELIDKGDIQLVAAAPVPCDRGPIGCRVMDAGKDYFADKAPFTTLAQLDDARKKVTQTGRKYAVYYSERLHTECSEVAARMVGDGAIGRVLQVLGLGPHRLNAPSRPSWFFEKEKYGGILCDIGSHQFEQFLFYTGAKDARVLTASVANYHHKEFPELEDFGQATLVGDNGATGYFRVDWFTPDGLRTWGDGRLVILGTKGYIELRKYIDVARDVNGDQVYLVNDAGEQHLSVAGQVGYPFFGRLVLDCLHRTENAMTQEHAFKAAEVCLKAQEMAVRLE